MHRIARFQQLLMLWRHLPGAVIAMTVLVLGVTIVVGTLQLRHSTRQQMIQREADILHSVALMQHLAGQSQDMLGGRLEDAADQFNLALQISQLKNVVAARLFDAEGDFLVAFPAYIKESRLGLSERDTLRRLQPFARYHADRALEDLFLEEFKPDDAQTGSASLMEVAIPLHRMNEDELLGVIQFVMDGRPIAREFAALDRNLWWQAGVALLIGGGLVSLVLGWAFRKLNRSNALLVQRTEDLQKANEELATSARTSALGAVTAHLLHGLSNPLSGLQDFMVQRREDSPHDEEWRHAVASTRRMRQLVEDATRVLAEEGYADHYELGLEDVMESLRRKCQPLAAAQGVRLQMASSGQGRLTNRQTNLLCLILENLLVNAVQASPAGTEVRLRARRHEDRLVFDVTDEGPGIPDAVVKRLFKPCQSTKEGGSGIGLAICQQLAHHLGASLNLSSTDCSGSTFSLQLPLHVPAMESSRAWAMEKA